MATHSSTLAWKIPWADEPGRLQSMGSLRVGHGLATLQHMNTFVSDLGIRKVFLSIQAKAEDRTDL